MYPALVETLLRFAPPVLLGSAWVTGWLATYLVQSTLLIGGVWLVARSPLGSRLGVARMATLWRVALVGGIATATLQSARVLAPLSGSVPVMREAGRAIRLMVNAEATTGVPAPRSMVARVAIAPGWPLWVALCWMGGVALGLGLFALARRRLRRALASPVPGEHTILSAALRDLRRRAGIERPVHAVVVRNLPSPVAVGASEIYVPQRALTEFDLAQLESILAHELAHLERRDGAWLMLARLVEVAFFFQPLNRLARRRMLDATELAADEWAVALTSQPVTLARCLARVAEWTVTGVGMTVPAMLEHPRSSLLVRVRRLTMPEQSGSPVRSPAVHASWLAALASLALLVPRPAIGGSQAAEVEGRRVVMWTDAGAMPKGTLHVFTADSNVVIDVKQRR